MKKKSGWFFHYLFVLANVSIDKASILNENNMLIILYFKNTIVRYDVGTWIPTTYISKLSIMFIFIN